MKVANHFPLAYLKDCFTYEESTGVLYWRRRPREHFPTDSGWKCFLTQLAGKAAGYRQRSGYVVVNLSGYTLKAHRIAFALIHQCEMADFRIIDHINGIRWDNRPANLREVDHTQNRQNLGGCYKSSTTGIQGVYRRRGKYEPKIGVGGRVLNLGSYTTIHQATIVRRYAENALFTHAKRYPLSWCEVRLVPTSVKGKILAHLLSLHELGDGVRPTPENVQKLLDNLLAETQAA